MTAQPAGGGGLGGQLEAAHTGSQRNEGPAVRMASPASSSATFPQDSPDGWPGTPGG